eukprot:tig00000215_g18647.t1
MLAIHRQVMSPTLGGRALAAVREAACAAGQAGALAQHSALPPPSRVLGAGAAISGQRQALRPLDQPRRRYSSAGTASQAMGVSAEDGWAESGAVEDLLKRAMTTAQAGDLAEAEGHMQAALDLTKRTLGASHRNTLAITCSLASLWRRKGDADRARALFESAVEACGTPGPGDDLGGRAALEIASIHLFGNRREDAERSIERAVELFGRSAGPSDVRLAEALLVCAQMLRHCGARAKAVPLVERALEVYTVSRGPVSPEAARALSSLGTDLAELGETERALPILERALGTHAGALAAGGEQRDYSVTVTVLAALHMKRGDAEAAAGLLERSLEDIRKALGPAAETSEPLGVLVGQLGVLRASVDPASPLHDPASALACLEAADRALSAARGAEHPARPPGVPYRFTLARLYLSQGRHDDARAVLQRMAPVLDHMPEAQKGGPLAGLAGGAFRLLAALHLQRGDEAAAASALMRAKAREADPGPDAGAGASGSN